MIQTAEFIHGKGFDAEVIRTDRRKTATVKVVEGKVSVVVPRRTSTDKVQALVSRKTRWIREKLLLYRKHQPPKPKEYVSGECFTYLGRNYRLKVESGTAKSVKLQGGRLVVQVSPSVRKRDRYLHGALTEWYREHALQKLQQKVQRYAKVVRVSPSSVGIKTFSGRWGSCSTKGNLAFNWKAIIAPNRIVDYLVVHELCHLHHHNHSPEFWKCVERVLPDYAESKEWLKVNGRWLDV
ncbi:M48 family metallopeptidase [Candidatus Thiosymbion oneisti]|uniref:M48 family metallopeptidase n=1 Tax=Candidatus Thiosymbion oneisti TaxID=589554 RepID=UPI000A63E9BD|nr:SprT family zinc-dependent metalloprotease [Candidatus Thiosymbion oneisti]